ncbi:isocitrate lyase/phosphoenolpyruvate mutase family protein [Streptomyces sp. NPDC102441]|uniref:isocitrate lyase/phosphoenolpyruvate mutase family protein n=1 Tax=Streptomyces sp. NPDC102441 TaxID=3366176 RepID=UPI0038097069
MRARSRGSTSWRTWGTDGAGGAGSRSGGRRPPRPGLSDPDGIAALTADLTVPLNILYTPAGPTLAELTALGVRRVSLGSLLYRRGPWRR